MDVCENIVRDKIYDDPNDAEIFVKLQNNDLWHTIFSLGYNKRVRVYNYKEGMLMQELEMRKNMKKYNL